MQWNLGIGMGRMTTQLIRNHPFAYDVQVLRKVIQRPADTGSMGGIPNFGGIGSLDSQDETDYDYEFLCNAQAVKATAFSPGNMTDNMDAPVGGDDEQTYLMIPARSKDHPQWEEIQFKTKDVLLFVLGADETAARVAYEVAAVDATCQLPPFMPRYVLNRRAELDLPADFEPDALPSEGSTAPTGDDTGNPVATTTTDDSVIGVLGD